MKLIVTAMDVQTSNGYSAITDNPIAIALGHTQTCLENITVRNNRVNALRAGYPVRFLIEGYTPNIHNKLMGGILERYECNLKPVAVIPETNKSV